MAQGAPRATCFQKTTSPGSRIDFIFGNGVATAMARDFRVLDDTGLPTHKPLLIDLQLDLSHQEGLRFRRPATPDLSWQDPVPEQETAKAADAIGVVHAASQSLWDACMEAGDVETAFHVLCSDGESYWGKRLGRPLPPHSRGRGMARLEKHSLMPRHTDAVTGAIPCKLHRLQKHLRGVEEVARKVSLKGLSVVRSQTDAANLWKRVRGCLCSSGKEIPLITQGPVCTGGLGTR